MAHMPSLSKQENHELLVKAKAGDPAAKELFFAHNMRLVSFVANKFNRSHLSYEDRFSAAQYGFLKAYNTFDFNKEINFATYSTRCMDNEILMSLRKNKHEYLQVSLDATIHADVDGNELTILDTLQSVESHDVDNMLEQENLSDVLSLFNDKSTELERQIVHMRFVEEKTQYEIAQSLQLSQSYICRIENGAIEKLKKITKSIEREVPPMGRRNTEIDVAKLMSMIEANAPIRQVMSAFDLSEGMYYYYKNKFQKSTSDVMEPKVSSEINKNEKAETRVNEEMTTRKATLAEAQKYGIKTVLDEVEWFQDEKLPNTPTIGINSSGLSLNAMSLEDLGVQVGEQLQIGYNPNKNALILQKGSRGLKIVKNNSGVKVDNKRLASWISQKRISKKRYVLQFDELAGVHYINLGLVGESK